jgi:hypothetical protein
VERQLIPLDAMPAQACTTDFADQLDGYGMDPLTEQHTVNWPIVCGYLRLAGLSTAKQRALTTAINQYCIDHELVLGGFFREDRASPDLAFAGLLQALTTRRMYGVIVPAAAHLGPKDLALNRRRKIDAAGAQLLLMTGRQQLIGTNSAHDYAHAVDP